MSKKSISIIGINYHPEDSAIGLYSTQMANYLAADNYDVSFITGFPYYPEWEIRADYATKGAFYREEVGNIKVYRYKQYTPKSPSFFSRVVHMMDFCFGSFVNVLRVNRPDLVIVVVPFTLNIIVGVFLSKLRGAKLWVHIHDF